MRKTRDKQTGRCASVPRQVSFRISFSLAGKTVSSRCDGVMPQGMTPRNEERGSVTMGEEKEGEARRRRRRGEEGDDEEETTWKEEERRRREEKNDEETTKRNGKRKRGGDS